MATVTIRNLDEDVKRSLRMQAAARGCSMEAEARAILAAAVRSTTDDVDTSVFRRVRGRWAGRCRTDDVMRMTREG
ncbi:MAG: plasmid stabilization protein [Verrucomicrobia bacterium]|jgi:plasmid stability protein|nr:plasmid stabilization protein [Verrucomicrobiota bacterium]